LRAGELLLFNLFIFIVFIPPSKVPEGEPGPEPAASGADVFIVFSTLGSADGKPVPVPGAVVIVEGPASMPVEATESWARGSFWDASVAAPGAGAAGACSSPAAGIMLKLVPTQKRTQVKTGLLPK
jgi:hypothetical protein